LAHDLGQPDAIFSIPSRRGIARAYVWIVLIAIATKPGYSVAPRVVATRLDYAKTMNVTDRSRGWRIDTAHRTELGVDVGAARPAGLGSDL
jgi:hypothetical protein